MNYSIGMKSKTPSATEKRPCEAGRRDWSYAAVSHRTGATGIWKIRKDSPLAFPGKHSSANILMSTSNLRNLRK